MNDSRASLLLRAHSHCADYVVDVAYCWQTPMSRCIVMIIVWVLLQSSWSYPSYSDSVPHMTDEVTEAVGGQVTSGLMATKG